MAILVDRFKKAWNVFTGKNTAQNEPDEGSSRLGYRPNRSRRGFLGERTTIASIYTRLSIDCASVELRHGKLDPVSGQYSKDMPSSLQDCLSLDPNIDQTADTFRRDIYMSLCEEGVIAIVAVDTTDHPQGSDGYDVLSMRVGRIVDWMPQHAEIELWNDRKGVHERVLLPKRQVAIVENPFYSVMNEPNSTLQRLIRKIRMMDELDEEITSGKLDVIFQLPYAVKSQAQRDRAESRRKDIEMQLTGSKYGIAYVDATEKITQLNRPVENNLLPQVENLFKQLYNQLGLTEGIFDGSASTSELNNYYNRTVQVMADAVAAAMKRTFLSKTARTQGQTIDTFRDPFKILPPEEIANMADKLTRNEIATPNEMRPLVGLLPSDDPKANELRNRNVSAATEPAPNEE